MRKTNAALASGAAVAMLASGVGLASASARPAGPAASGTEHIYLMTTQPSESRYSVIMTGVFTAGGTDVSGSKVDKIELPGGTFKINHSGPFHVLKEQVNRTTCLAVFEATATATIGHGTGRYAGISGTAKALVNETFIARRNSKGACNPNANPSVVEQTITAKAHVKL
jgi:hypothetical protein